MHCSVYTYLATFTLVHCSHILCFALHLTAAFEFNVSLELQGGHCSDQLTLICRHSETRSAPLWIHNGTVESGEVLSSAFPGVWYSFQSNTEHRVTISGVGNVQAFDGYIIQCVYSIQGNLIKSNAVKYSFTPPGQCCIQDMYIPHDRYVPHVPYLST